VLTTSQVLSFVAAALALALIPGPSVLFVVSRGIALGRRAGLATVAGNALGTCCSVIAVAVGVGAVVQRSAVVFNVMKVAGAGYLVWLGVKAIRARASFGASISMVGSPTSTGRIVRDGFIVGVSNPKTTLFFLAVLPQFTVPSQGHVSLQLLALGCIFVAVASTTDSMYALAAGSVRRWLDRRPERGPRVGVASGVIMIGLGVRVALTGRAS
jgi:threonine/homoserine/homoserine lactone efflux protein